MQKNARRAAFLGLSAVFLLCDQILKYLARANPSARWYAIRPWLGWEYFRNEGVAFSIPAPPAAVAILTPFILAGLIVMLTHGHKIASEKIYSGLLFIIAGAVSNLFDRLAFDATIDYIRIATGVFNLADILIAAGAVTLLTHLSPKKRRGLSAN